MKIRQKLPKKFLSLLVITLLPVQPMLAQEADDDSDIIELSPFVVNTTDDVGYLATSTLAGTRLNTELRDLGAAITVVTQEFLQDLDASDVTEYLQYTAGAEVGGTWGNFAGGETVVDSRGRATQAAARENPQGNQRIRGIGAAQLTRNYFRTDFSADSYNTERVTINRGPNAVLFGIGNPAGVIESTTKRAQTGRDLTNLGFRFGREDSYRATLDANRVLIDGRLAVRIAGLHETDYFKQKPAFEKDRRIYAALESVLLKNEKSKFLGPLSLRGSYEYAMREANPVNIIPPTDSYSLFFEPLDGDITNLPGINVKTGRYDPSYPFAPSTGLVGTWQYKNTIDPNIPSNNAPERLDGQVVPQYFIQIPIVFDTPGQQVAGWMSPGSSPALQGLAGIMGRLQFKDSQFDVASTANAWQGIAGFASRVIQDRNVFDNENHLLSGNSNNVDQRFRAQNFALEQTLLNNNAGFEINYDNQQVDTHRLFMFDAGQNGAENGQNAIKIDVAEFLGNGEPNPNIGRPFIVQNYNNNNFRTVERESIRATAFLKFDLNEVGKNSFLRVPLGRHTLTGMYSNETRDQDNRNYTLSWNSDDPTFRDRANVARMGAFRRRPIVQYYVGPSVLGSEFQTKNDLRITNVFDAPVPMDGDQHTVGFYDRRAKEFVVEDAFLEEHLNNGGVSREEIESNLFAWQGYLLNDHIVGLWSFREDTATNWSDSSGQRDSDGRFLEEGPNFTLDEDPSQDITVDSISWSVVARYPEALLGDLPFGVDLSVFYSESENFLPAGLARNIYQDYLGQPSGETTEYGILLEVLDRKISMKFNWFETSQQNIRDGRVPVGQVYGFHQQFFLNRYSDAQSQGIPFDTIMGVTEAGYNSYEDIYDVALTLLPPDIMASRNTTVIAEPQFEADGVTPLLDEAGERQVIDYTFEIDPIPGSLTDTRVSQAEGFEFELIGKLTPNWNVAFNLVQTETINSGAAGPTSEVAAYLFNALRDNNLLEVSQAPALTETQNIRERFALNISTALNAVVATNGAVSQEQREWRAGLVTSYTFDEDAPDWLKNWTIGGALRWQSKASTGTPFLTGQALKEKLAELNEDISSPSDIADDSPLMDSQYPDLDNPFWNDPIFNGDVFFRYKRPLRLLGRDVDWTLQLNIRNLIKDDDPMIVATNPDGQVAIIRNPNVTRWSVSNSIRF